MQYIYIYITKVLSKFKYQYESMSGIIYILVKIHYYSFRFLPSALSFAFCISSYCKVYLITYAPVICNDLKRFLRHTFASVVFALQVRPISSPLHDLIIIVEYSLPYYNYLLNPFLSISVRKIYYLFEKKIQMCNAKSTTLLV